MDENINKNINIGTENLFEFLIGRLQMETMFHLGKIMDPSTQKTVKNLDLAKINIDTLDMIKKKTMGNLTKDEEKLLNSTLHNLRMNYIDEVEAEKKEKEKKEKNKQ